MGEKIIGFHAIEEGLKRAASGLFSILCVEWGQHPDTERQAQ
jgi:hypothetical protein